LFFDFSFVFLSVLTFGLTGGVIARVEDPGCYLYECDCYLYTEFSYGYTLTEGHGRDVVPFAMNCCVSAEAHHYDANNNPLSVYASAYGECRYSIDASPWILTAKDLA